MASVVIQKRKKQKGHSYVITYRDPVTYKSKYYKTCSKYRDAQIAANGLRDLIDTGKIPKRREQKVRSKLITFAEIAVRQKMVWDARFRRKELRPDTYNGYLILINVLNRTFGNRLMCEITEQVILDYQEKLFTESSPVNANRHLFIIKQVFKFGYRLKIIDEDIAASIRYLSEKNHERNKFLMPDEIIILVKASQQTRAKFYMPALIYLGTDQGASRQEALSVKWKNINFNFNGQGLIELFRTKNKKRRTGYLMPRTKQALLEWQAHLDFMRRKKRIEVVEDKFVFCRLNGKPIKRFDNAWRRTCSIAGITDFHYHDLRHTFCSNLLLSGSGLKDAKDMIGHSDLAMTDRYSHLTLLHKKDCQDKLANHYINGTKLNN
ncbi:MAG: site-specific integrase [Deltaproteobacteria bacterium]|nr:site-specific integrase [Deltaproteobacteria bacterium]